MISSKLKLSDNKTLTSMVQPSVVVTADKLRDMEEMSECLHCEQKRTCNMERDIGNNRKQLNILKFVCIGLLFMNCATSAYFFNVTHNLKSPDTGLTVNVGHAEEAGSKDDPAADKFVQNEDAQTPEEGSEPTETEVSLFLEPVPLNTDDKCMNTLTHLK